MSDDFDKVVSTLDRISHLSRLRDKVAIAKSSASRRCGNCSHWMKSRSCPMERNVGGYSRGPIANTPACSKFQITQTAVELQRRRIKEAVDFANAHDLPTPEGWLS